MTVRPRHVNYPCKCQLQRKIKHARFKITKMDDIEKWEEYLLATSCDDGESILLIQLLVAFFPTATFVK